MTKRICSNPLSWIAILLIGSSCSVKPEDAIIGKWGDPNKPSDGAMEFFKDGTFKTIPPESTKRDPALINIMCQNMSGTYTFIDKDRIKMTYSGLMSITGPQVLRISATRDELIIYEVDTGKGVHKNEPPAHLRRLK